MISISHHQQLSFHHFLLIFGSQNFSLCCVYIGIIIHRRSHSLASRQQIIDGVIRDAFKSNDFFPSLGEKKHSRRGGGGGGCPLSGKWIWSLIQLFMWSAAAVTEFWEFLHNHESNSDWFSKQQYQVQMHSGIAAATCPRKQVRHISSHHSDACWVNVWSRLDNEVFVMLREAKALQKEEEKDDNPFLFFKCVYSTRSDPNSTSLARVGKERAYWLCSDILRGSKLLNSWFSTVFCTEVGREMKKENQCMNHWSLQ